VVVLLIKFEPFISRPLSIESNLAASPEVRASINSVGDGPNLSNSTIQVLILAFNQSLPVYPDGHMVWLFYG